MPGQIPFAYIADACKETDTSVVLIGGQALGARGYQRITLDVDFMITEGDYEKLKPAICSRRYTEVVRTNVAAKLRAESDDFVDIDFMFVDRDTFEGIKKESREENYKDCKLLVPKVEHMIALKLHAIKQQPRVRELKDLNDIIELIKANRVDVKSEAFKSTCMKFGTTGLYEKILHYTKTNG